MQPGNDRSVFVDFSHHDVGDRLAQRLRQLLAQTVSVLVGRPPDDATPSIVVADDRAVPPAACDQLSAAGHTVVVMAAVPRVLDEATYAASGAHAYLAMAVDLTSLLAVLTALL
jgi:hypothetical protein